MIAELESHVLSLYPDGHSYEAIGERLEVLKTVLEGETSGTEARR